MRPSLLLTTALVFGFIGAEITEAKEPPPSVAESAKIQSWTPQSGPVGTLVTLKGSGFTNRTVLLIGGRRVRPIKTGTRVISFRIPARYGDAAIVMREPGVAHDIKIGSFEVWADPEIKSFAPSSGAPGTRIELRGRNFSADDEVRLGAQELAIFRYSKRSLIVTLPEGAVSGAFHVKNKRQASSTSRREFKVVAPAPLIHGLAPDHGRPGTAIRLQGDNFGDDMQIRYGSDVLSINQFGENWIEVSIPEEARHSAAIVIASPRGGARSPTRFRLEMPPTLTGVSRSGGVAGDSVTLRGSNFRPGDKIYLGEVSCKIHLMHANQIIVEIPRDATSASFAVQRKSQRVTGSARFNVFHKPAVSSLQPLHGSPGTQIVVKGEHLAGARFYLGKIEIRPTSLTPRRVLFEIPEGALTASLRVVSRGGEVLYPKSLEVWNFPMIKRVAPPRGPVGAILSLSGKWLNNATQVFLGNAEMPIVGRKSAARVLVRVPELAASGPIRTVAYGRNSTSSWSFTVLRPPELDDFNPKKGAAGTSVTIAGANFSKTTRVFYGGAPLPVAHLEPTRLRVVIPAYLRESGRLSVQGVGKRATATTNFSLLIPPSARSFSPSRGKPASDLTIYGNALAISSIVKLGEVRARVLRVSPTGNKLVVRVPEMGAGKHELSVENNGLRASARKRFTIEAWGSISDIQPRRAHSGQTIMLAGTGLGSARVFCGEHELQVSRRNAKGTKIWARVSKACTGTSSLTLDDQGHRSASRVDLQIAEPQ